MNTELAAKIADVIENHTERWYQADWAWVQAADEADAYGIKHIPVGDIVDSLTQQVTPNPYACSTTGCVAGWACYLGLPRDYELAIWEDMVYGPDGEEVYIPETAMRLLDLTWDQRMWLFSGTRTRAEVLWALRRPSDWSESDAFDMFP